MRILVTSAGETNGAGYGALLTFDSAGALLGRYSDDPGIVDPRGMAPSISGLLYVNASAERVLALDHAGKVILDSGPIPDLEPGGGKFGPDDRYYVTVRRSGSIRALSASLAGDGELVVPERSVEFPHVHELGWLVYRRGHRNREFIRPGVVAAELRLNRPPGQPGGQVRLRRERQVVGERDSDQRHTRPYDE